MKGALFSVFRIGKCLCDVDARWILKVGCRDPRLVIGLRDGKAVDDRWRDGGGETHHHIKAGGIKRGWRGVEIASGERIEGQTVLDLFVAEATGQDFFFP